MHPHRLRLAALLTTVIAVLACGDDDAGFGGDYYPPFADAGADASLDTGGEPTGDVMDDMMDDTDDDVFVPEEPEEEVVTNRPTASRRYVFVANRSLDSVAKIDSETLAVTPIPVGREPTIVRTVPNGDVATVLNVGSDSVSVIEARPDRDTVTTADIVRGCNQLSMAPSGTHVIAWYDNLSAEAGDRIGSLQEVSVVDLATAEVFDVSVGFNIRSVAFDTAGTTAFVITDTGVNPIDLESLSADVAVASVRFGDDPLVQDVDREVAITGGGAYAVLRSSSHQGVRVVDLATERAASVALPGLPTDVDLLSDDATALVALRDQGQLAVLRLNDVIDDPSRVELVDIDAPAGLVSISADESFALTYTTLDGDRRLGVVELSGELRGSTHWLQKGIRSVFVGPGATTALVVHSSEAGRPVPGEDIDQFVAKAEGISLFHLSTGYAKLVLLDVEPDDIVFTPDGDDAFVMLADEATGTQEIVMVDTRTFASRSIAMEGLPESIGVVPGTGRVFVSQRSETGRITFIDADDGSVRHVSAFQLNAFID